MATHSLAMLRTLESAGIERKHAEAITDIVVTHSDETGATKADIARIEGKLETMHAEMKAETRAINGRLNLLTNLVIGLYIGLAVLIMDKLL